MKILIVEDNPIHLEVAKMQLKDHELVIFKSFTEFLKKTASIVIERKFNEPTIDISDFEVVLTDLYLPSSNDHLVETEAATGFVVAMAAIRAGVKMVGIVTDANHHEDPISKGFDMFFDSGSIFSVGEAKIMLTNNSIIDGEPRIKNWKRVLDYLTDEELAC
jgi:CheY-like chemotaxis protein